MAQGPSTMKGRGQGIGPGFGTSQVKFDTRQKEIRDMSPSRGFGAFGFGVAKVLKVDYVKHEVGLQIWYGEDQLFQYTAIPNTYPGAGARHFLGGLPEPGDMCIVGFMAMEPKQPVIVGWLPISATAGLEWLPVQDFLPTETDMSPRRQAEFEGIYGRTRFKMRQMVPGSIFVSSSQGSDIYLDEGIQIQNRRGNEIRLRDQDQAIIFRSQQEFHATGGTRVYSGMVQRDATFLPARMFSDGVYWDAPVQQDNGRPFGPEELGESPIAVNNLTPHAVFVRSDSSIPFPDSGVFIQDNVDPYSVLARGLFIGSDGAALDPTKVTSDGEYGGKPIFRVSVDPNPLGATAPVNGAIADEQTDSDTLTEYRIELDHTWDGRLPVTEQTDGFDADRIPSNATQDEALDIASPFIEWVLGSVVGNDAFSRRGRTQYGLPLRPVIFDDEKLNPRLDSALGLPIGEHAASLFKITPPIQDSSRASPTFVATTKDGRVRASIGGSQDGDSLEMALAGGMRIEANNRISLKGTYLDLKLDNGDPTNNNAFALSSDNGAILIEGNAPTTKGSFSARVGTTDIQENQLPGVQVSSPNADVHVKSGRNTKISGANAVFITDTNEVTITSKQTINHFSDKFLVQTNTLDRTIQGRETTLYSGPKNFLPTNAPFRETKFAGTPLTGHAGGTTDEYTMLFGDRQENFRVGDHTTSILVGDMTYTTALGTWTARAGIGQMRLDSTSGLNVTIPTGTINIQSTLATSVKALASLTMKSNGITKVSGTSITLGGTGNSGRILSGADIDPVSGKTFGALGLGSPGHRLGPPI